MHLMQKIPKRRRTRVVALTLPMKMMIRLQLLPQRPLMINLRLPSIKSLTETTMKKLQTMTKKLKKKLKKKLIKKLKKKLTKPLTTMEMSNRMTKKKLKKNLRALKLLKRK